MRRDDIQGLIFSGYAALPASALLLLAFRDGQPHAWLRRVLPRISSGRRAERFERARLNLAFTASGLARLGLDGATIRGFSEEFVRGMAHPDSAARLGDVGEDAPQHWTFARGEVDAVLLLYADTRTAFDERLAALEGEIDRHGLVVSDSLRTYLPDDGREHFGFRMSVSQPNLRGGGRSWRAGPRVRAGEFVLGERDAAGRRQRGPFAAARRSTRESPPLTIRRRCVDLGANGSYLAIRKLEQDVASFRRFLGEQAAAGHDPERLAARLIGRWPSGASLALHPAQAVRLPDTAESLFYQAQDPHGLGCPLGAHVRRAYPRDAAPGGLAQAARHRLLRRGRLYGDDEPNAERGLLFLALNADLRRQFEHVQGRWLNGEHFADLRNECDPICGGAGSREPDLRRFTVQAEPLRERFVLPRWVRVRGGLYAFMPSLRALGYLADSGPP